MDMNDFIDVGAGWFLYDDPSNRLTAVCDAMSNEPTHNFGPAAWGGRDGPLSGKVILEAHAVVRGQWDQVGPDEWKWFSEDGQEFNEPPSDWPRVIKVRDGKFGVSLNSLAERIVASNAEFAELLRIVTTKMPQRNLLCVATGTRFEAAKLRHPHIFGEPAAPYLEQ
jgi:hypothetical protein